MEITDTLAAKSDQLNAIDLIGGPQTVTITGVKVTGGEQPVSIFTAEFGNGRPFKPCLTVRRAIVEVWGGDTSTYTGRRMTLFRDAEVTFGNDKPGGIRVSHLSDMGGKAKVVWLPAKRGKSAPLKIEPLPDSPPPTPAITAEAVEDFARAIAEAATEADLTAIAADLKNWDLGTHKTGLLKAWNERKAALKAAAEPKADVQ